MMLIIKASEIFEYTRDSGESRSCKASEGLDLRLNRDDVLKK
jgi:hypothetical protein